MGQDPLDREDLLWRIDALTAEVAALSDFLENANAPLHSVGADGVVRWANRAELSLLGYAWDEYVGHPIAAFHVDAAAAEDLLARLSRGEVVTDFPALIRRRDGTIWRALITSSGRFENGKLVRTRCFTRDAGADEAAAATGALWLCVNGVEIKVHGDCFTIGRGAACDLVIRSTNVSRRHCQITRVRGAYYLVDVGSTCGTELGDGSMLAGRKRLEEGDAFRVGDELIRCSFSE